MILPKLVITDIDGVWTDGGMFYDENGGEWKKFNTSDSAGVLFLRKLGIPMAIMTGENSQAVANRAKKLKIDHVFLAAKNKLELATQFCSDLSIDLEEVAFIGDDINDLKLLNAVGLSASPANAPLYIKDRVHFVTQRRGGEGAFREFVETILLHHDLLDRALQDFL
jgi:YrbI family 3-deoxy-D-manno-octulosonate 8-phosphate phosphatase